MEKVVVIQDQFWANKRVLVTGHTGFKGGWLSLWLNALGAKVYGVSLPPPTTPSFYELVRVRDFLSDEFIVDIRDRESLRNAINATQANIVLHLAAQPLVRESYQDPAGTFTTNVIGTLNLFDCIRLTDHVSVVINVTTDKCYENQNWDWPYRENDSLGGFDPYSNSKACSELVSSCFRNSYFASQNIRLATARAGNVIGGGDWAVDRLIPDIIKAINNNRSVNIRFPGAIRPWQHVLEPLSGYMLLAEQLWSNPDRAASWNFGPSASDNKSVEWILNRIRARFPSLKWHVDTAEKPHETQTLTLDSSKAVARLGWRRRWLTEIAIEKTIEWYSAHAKGADLQRLSLAQIQEYCES